MTSPPASATPDPTGAPFDAANDPDCPPLIAIGRIIKPVGLAGEVKVWPLTDFPERFQTLRQVRVTTTQGDRVCRVSAARQVGRHLYLRFSGVASVEQADLLRGGLIQIPEAERVPLPEGSYYQYEIVGLEVLTEAGRRLGQIGDILQTGSNDVYVVRGEQKEEYYIPALATVVRKIDLVARQMIVCPMQGLLEANARKTVKSRQEPTGK